MSPLRPARANLALAWAFTIALGLSPVLLMSTLDGGSAGYYLLVLLSIIVLFVVRPAAPGQVWCDNRREYVWMGVGVAVANGADVAEARERAKLAAVANRRQ